MLLTLMFDHPGRYLWSSDPVLFRIAYKEHLTFGSKLYRYCLSADPKRL